MKASPPPKEESELAQMRKWMASAVFRYASIDQAFDALITVLISPQGYVGDFDWDKFSEIKRLRQAFREDGDRAILKERKIIR